MTSLKYLMYTGASTKINVEGFHQDVRDILLSSRKNNPAKGITGLLVVKELVYLQYLEGPAEQIDQLYKTIEKDARSKMEITIYEGSLEERVFPNWRMALSEYDHDVLKEMPQLVVNADNGLMLPSTEGDVMCFLDIFLNTASDSKSF